MLRQPPVDEVRAAIVALRDAQQAIYLACEAQPDGWRHTVIAQRRILADRFGVLMSLLRDVDPVAFQLCATVALLRSRLAEHQASWPAVAIETGAPKYRASVERLRAAYRQLDRDIAALDRAVH